MNEVWYFLGEIAKEDRSMKDMQLNDTEFIKLVNKHPKMKSQIEAILMIAEASVEGLVRADDVEMRVRDSVRDLGKNAIENWAESQEKNLSEEFAKNNEIKKHSKKNSTGTQLLDK